MDAITTSGESAVTPAMTMRGEWSRFLGFLRRPVLPARAPLPQVAGLIAVLRLFALDTHDLLELRYAVADRHQKRRSCSRPVGVL